MSLSALVTDHGNSRRGVCVVSAVSTVSNRCHHLDRPGTAQRTPVGGVEAQWCGRPLSLSQLPPCDCSSFVLLALTAGALSAPQEPCRDPLSPRSRARRS